MNRHAKRAFTLLEMLIAISILALILATCHLALSSALQAWRRGSEYLERQHHSDFAFDQILTALYSTCFFDNDELDYGLQHVDRDCNGLPGDELSWVTSSSAFVRAPYSLAPHRLFLTIDSDLDEPSLSAKAYFPFDQEEQTDAIEYRSVSRNLIGLNCRFYDTLEEEWVDEWTTSNAVPKEIEITLYAPPINENEDPITFTRILRIPVAETSTKSSNDNQ